LEVYRSCPRKYYYSYILKLPKIDRPWFVFGNFNHLILEKFFKYILYFRKRKVAYDKKSLMYRAFKSALRKFHRLALANKTMPLTDKQIDETKNIIKNFFNKVSESEPNVFAVEKEIILDLGEGTHLIGYIDRIDKISDTEFRIVDYKTSKEAYSVKKNDQLDIYAIGFKNSMGDSELSVYKQLDFIKLGKETDPNIRHDNSKDEEIIDKIKTLSNEIKVKKELYSDNRAKWEPIENGFCWSCDFKRTCLFDRGSQDSLEL